jgi:hypothetical protein
MSRTFPGSLGATLLAAALLGGCGGGDADRVVVDQTAAPPGDMQTTQPAPGMQPGTQPGTQPGMQPDLRLEVDIAARELHVFRGGNRVETHPVAVGTAEWPTPTGEWTIGQVVWNPRWIPPEQEWAEGEEVSEPGAPDNPLGRAQLVYSAPNSVHGTNAPQSLGQAVSHGSIRVSNEVAMDLARQVMEAGGAGRDEAWYQRARQNRTERQDVAIPNPIPIRVHSGGGGQGGAAGRTGTGS